MKAGGQDELRARIAEYLAGHHVMTVATMDPEGRTPHAAHVFYVMDDRMRLIFLSQRSSLHGLHIGKEASVAATVSEAYEDWRQIQGLQLWGRVRLLSGAAEASALARYLVRFPFVKDLLRNPGSITRLQDIGVYRMEAKRAALTDNTRGLFGRETVELVRQ